MEECMINGPLPPLLLLKFLGLYFLFVSFTCGSSIFFLESLGFALLCLTSILGLVCQSRLA